MNLLRLLVLCILGLVDGAYEIPQYDSCALKVLLCDDFVQPLTVADNSTLEMFTSTEQLDSVCERLLPFRACLENAEKYCNYNYEVDIGFKLIETRRLAIKLCAPGSKDRKNYFTVQRCVNRHSHSVTKFCSKKAEETVGLNFDLSDFESECRYLGTLESCHVEVIESQCGIKARNVLEKLIKFRGQRDYMCSAYEKEKLDDLSSFQDVMRGYVEEYNDLASQMKAEDNGIDKHEDFDVQEEDFEETGDIEAFQEDFEPKEVFEPPQEDFEQEETTTAPSVSDAIFDQQYDFDSKTHQCSKSRPPLSLMSMQSFFDSTCTPPVILKRSIDPELSDENCACKTKSSFLLSIFDKGIVSYIGCGMAEMSWATASPLKDIFCLWKSNPKSPMKLFECTIQIGGKCVLAEEYSKSGIEKDKISISVFESTNDDELRKVAELKVLHVFPTYLEETKNLLKFERESIDFRHWCSKQHKANLKGPDQTPSTSRIGLIQSDFNRRRMENGQRKISDEKYNFYESANPEYPADNEINLMSSGDVNFEPEKTENNVWQVDYEEIYKPFIDNVKSGANNLDKPGSLHHSSSRQYRPTFLFRPRLGETPETDDATMSSDSLEINEGGSNPDMPSFEDVFEDDYASHLYAEEQCPLLPENISKLTSKPGMHSEESYWNMADLVRLGESKRYTKFPISKNEDNILLYKVKNIEEPEIAQCDREKESEVYVTPSAKITPSLDVSAVFEDTTVQSNFFEDLEHLGEDSPEYAEALDVEVEDLDENIAQPTTPRRLELDFIKSTSNEDPLVDASAYLQDNYKSSFGEELSPKSDMLFSKRSNYLSPIERERLNEVLEMLAEINLNIKILKKKMKEVETKETMIWGKIEL